MRSFRWKGPFIQNQNPLGSLLERVFLDQTPGDSQIISADLALFTSFLSCRTPWQVRFAPAGLLPAPLINHHRLWPHSKCWNQMWPFLLITEPSHLAFQMTLGGLHWQPMSVPSLDSESVSCSVMSGSVRPWGLQLRLLCPWDSPGKNIGVGCHSLLQRIFLTQGSN